MPAVWEAFRSRYGYVPDGFASYTPPPPPASTGAEGLKLGGAEGEEDWWTQLKRKSKAPGEDPALADGDDTEGVA